ncbi:MAG: hypothetical protein V4604_12260 [Bacteroidota bacterium]
MADPITFVAAPQQQHMLFMFLPIKKGTFKKAVEAVSELSNAAKMVTTGTQGPGDIRASTGVHFSFFYGLPADTTPVNPVLPVPSFQTAPGRDLLVVQALYDADFAPYISAFVNVPAIAIGLNYVLSITDEIDVDPNDPTSAAFILANGGVVSNPDAFNCFLMRYNFADPTLPASLAPVSKTQKYLFQGTFPGLTVGNILQNYPDANTLWPFPAAPIEFAQSVAPSCGDD